MATVELGDVVDDAHPMAQALGVAELHRLPDRGQTERLTGVNGEVEVFPLDEVEGPQVLRRREAIFGPGDVEAADPLVAKAHRELGDRLAQARLAHRGEDRAHQDVTALIGRLLRAEGEAVEHGAHDLVQREPAVQVQLGREAHLGVDDAVAREVDGALGGHALELVPRLHDGRRVGEAFEVAHEVAAGRVRDEPTTQLVGVVGRQPVIVHLVGEFEDRLGPQPAVEVLVQQDLWRLGG